MRPSSLIVKMELHDDDDDDDHRHHHHVPEGLGVFPVP